MHKSSADSRANHMSKGGRIDYLCVLWESENSIQLTENRLLRRIFGDKWKTASGSQNFIGICYTWLNNTD